MQGFWTIVPASPLLVILSGTCSNKPLIPLELFGLIIWLLGFIIESVADHQKSVFRSDDSNRNKFIKTGLWKYSRHPNYVGEIIIWIGNTIFAYASLKGL